MRYRVAMLHQQDMGSPESEDSEEIREREDSKEDGDAKQVDAHIDLRLLVVCRGYMCAQIMCWAGTVHRQTYAYVFLVC